MSKAAIDYLGANNRACMADNLARDVDYLTVQHPAKYSGTILHTIGTELNALLPYQATIVDCFAGVGGIHLLEMFNPSWATFAVELEAEWAEQSMDKGPTWWGDFFAWNPAACGIEYIDAFVTSCTYGNRMADKHEPSPEDTSKRITYKHKLGRGLTPNSSAGMQWGPEYRVFHLKAWRRVFDLLPDDGLFVLNVSNHIRKAVEVPVVEWHEAKIERLGFTSVMKVKVDTPRMGFGANGQTRVDGEWVLVYRK